MDIFFEVVQGQQQQQKQQELRIGQWNPSIAAPNYRK
jgi:hypothetical protein